MNRLVRSAIAFLLALLLAVVSLAAGPPAASGRGRGRSQEGWKILERIRRLASSAPADAGGSEAVQNRDALVAELERLGWTTKVVEVGPDEARAGTGRLAAVIAEKGVAANGFAELVARLPIGEGSEAGPHACSGAAVLLDVAARLQASVPRRAWRLGFFESEGAGLETARREAARNIRDRASAVVAVEHVGRRPPLVAIPFPASEPAIDRASPLGVFENLRGAALAEGGQVFLGDPGREIIFTIASRVSGVRTSSLALPFAEAGSPAILLTDTAPSDMVERDGSRGAELDPDRLAQTAAILESFLVRVDQAPPSRSKDDVVVWNDRSLREDQFRNVLLIAAILAAARLVSYRRERRSQATELAQLSAALLFAAGVVVPAIEKPIPTAFLLAPAVVATALLPPGRILSLLAILATLVAPLARLAFYFEVEAASSGVFPAGSTLSLLREPPWALVAAGLLASAVGAAFLRHPPSPAKKKKEPGDEGAVSP